MKAPNDTFRYYLCPKCQHAEIDGDDFEYDDEQGWKDYRCENCGFEWTEVYDFAYHCDREGFRLDQYGERVKMNAISSSGSALDLPLTFN